MPQSVEKIKDHVELFQRARIPGDASRQARELRVPTPPSRSRRSRVDQDEGVSGKELCPRSADRQSGEGLPAAGRRVLRQRLRGNAVVRARLTGLRRLLSLALSRHFKEPASAVSSSMTEDAAVFGGLNNMVEGLANAHSLYKPKMIAVSTTCMAEVIGDDLNAFIASAKEKGSVPAEFHVPFAHTPAFQGSHVNGYDNMLLGILTYFWERTANGRPARASTSSRLRRLLRRQQPGTQADLDLMEVPVHDPVGPVRCLRHAERRRVPHVRRRHDASEAVEAALHAKATISMQEYCSRKTMAFIKEQGPGSRGVELSRWAWRDRRAPDGRCRS
jgi:nitrogenase molybdenum-iron protein beta chain